MLSRNRPQVSASVHCLRWYQMRSLLQPKTPPLALGSILLMFLACGVACSSGASPSDLIAIEKAQEEFSEDFEIEARRDLYIEARYQRTSCPPREDVEALYAVLLMEGGTPRRDSSFAYLNLWTGSNRFCYQLFFDPASQTIKESGQPYY